MKQRILGLVLIAIAISWNVFPSRAQNMKEGEHAVALFVEFQFDEKDMDTAIELLTEMQNMTLENEEGCVAYDMLVSDDHPNTIFLYESYENGLALKAHGNAPYYKDIVGKKLPQYIKKSKIINLYPVNDIGTDMEEDMEE